jgi:hypothetical protein
MLQATKRIIVDGIVYEEGQEVTFPTKERKEMALKRGVVRKITQNKKELKEPKQTKELKGEIKTK